MRAVTMFLIAMGARITGRIYDMMSALSVTAMMLLVESPAYLLDSGFLLSFGCVLGMGFAAEKICALAGAEKKMDKGTGKSYSSSACDSAGDAEVFRRSLYCRIYPESVGASKCGGSADWRNGGAAAGNSQYSCGKTVILPARVLLLFYEYLCSLAGRSGWSTWIGGEPEIWQIVVYYGFLIIVLFMGQYIKETAPEEKSSQ